MSRGSSASFSIERPIRTTRGSGSSSAPAATAARRSTAALPQRTFSRSRRRSATTGAASDHGPLYMGKDTHALVRRCRRTSPSKSWPATASRPSSSATTAYTPTPVISRAILVHNHGRTTHLADGIVITPSHNPPEDGGFKYNPPQRRSGRYRRDGLDSAASERAARRKATAT